MAVEALHHCLGAQVPGGPGARVPGDAGAAPRTAQGRAAPPTVQLRDLHTHPLSSRATPSPGSGHPDSLNHTRQRADEATHQRDARPQEVTTCNWAPATALGPQVTPLWVEGQAQRRSGLNPHCFLPRLKSGSTLVLSQRKRKWPQRSTPGGRGCRKSAVTGGASLTRKNSRCSSQMGIEDQCQVVGQATGQPAPVSCSRKAETAFR